MNELEQDLRESLHHRASSGVAAATDPWVTFTARERRHRQRRVARRVAVGVSGAGLVASLALGVVPLPEALPAISTNPAAGRSMLQDAPTRGSLAGDTAWLDGLRREVPDHDDGDEDGRWRVVNRDQIRFQYAGDVPGARVALAIVHYRFGVLEDTQSIWLSGPPGASPQQMEEMSNEDPVDVSARLDGSDTAPGYLVVVAPPGSAIRTSFNQEITYGADGRIHRPWTPASTADGVAVVPVPASRRAPETRVQVTLRGRTLYDAAATMGWSSDEDGTGTGPAPVSKSAVTAALAAARGPGLDPALARNFVTAALNDARLDHATPFTIPWTGVVEGRKTALIELRPKGGGRIFYTEGGTSSEQWTDLRLLVPAEGAQTRPLPWRIWGNDEKRPLGLGVYVPAGATRTELVVDGTTTPITPDSSGFALVGPPGAGSTVVVRSYRADGGLMGETTLPVSPVNTGGLPGDDPATRLPD